jgi:hypothetical protein
VKILYLGGGDVTRPIRSQHRFTWPFRVLFTGFFLAQ